MGTTLTLAAYGACVLAAATLGLVAARRPERLAPLRDVLDALARRRAARVLLVVFWWWLGWHFLVGPTT